MGASELSRSFVAAAAAARVTAVANEVVASKRTELEERNRMPNIENHERPTDSDAYTFTPDQEVKVDNASGISNAKSSEYGTSKAMLERREHASNGAPDDKNTSSLRGSSPDIVTADRVTVIFAAEPESCPLCEHIASGSTMPKSRGGHTYGPGCRRAKNRKRK